MIPEDFAKKIRGMAGYRNRLPHLYWQVGCEGLYYTLKESLDDLREFNRYIKGYLKKIP